jgi:hypothetical protein
MASRLCLALGACLFGCATLPEPGGGGENLPSANAGPFREITDDELGNLRTAPNVFTDTRTYARAPSVVDLDGDPKTLDVYLYVGAAVPDRGEEASPDDPPTAVVRYGALDGRSFDRAADVVLEIQEDWEGAALGAPSALRVGSEIWIYYAAAGGIGLARSSDGLAFTRERRPVLEPAGTSWEAGATPRSPGVVRLSNGAFRMFYEVEMGGDATWIGEARSTDGVTWERRPEPAIVPSKAGSDPSYDVGSAGAPHPIETDSADGTKILRLYYGARDRAGLATIALAARFGDGEPFQRAVAPVFGTTNALTPTEPCVVEFADFTLLYVTQRTSNAATGQNPAVAGGVAPGTVTLPEPDPL